MKRRSNNSVVANPVLVGALTVLVVVVGVMLAYNANSGLPFVPTRELRVVLPNGQNLVPSNEVREGGVRTGVIAEMRPVKRADGTLAAELVLQLDADQDPLPTDSTFAVRPKSAIGSKYIEVTRGRAAQTFADGASAPVTAGRNAVDIDDLAAMYDEKTRRAAQKTLVGTSDALAGRGMDLNTTLSELPRFFEHLGPVTTVLAAPGTRLRRFVRETDDLLSALAPVAPAYARSFSTGATTFAALVDDREAYEQSIALAPATLEAGTRSLKVQRPYLADLAGLSQDLERTARAIRPALPPLNAALAEAVPAQRAAVPIARRTQDTLLALSDLTGNPTTLSGLRGLTATVDTLQPQLRYLGPKFTVCNTWNFFWAFQADSVSTRNATGTAQRTSSISGDRQTNQVTSMGATAPANGEGLAPGDVPQVLHAQPYGRAVDEQGNADCEDGQRGYTSRGLPPGGSPEDRERFQHVVLDKRTPGNQGPTFKQIIDGKGVGIGPLRVPAGQTFDAEPDTRIRVR